MSKADKVYRVYYKDGREIHLRAKSIMITTNGDLLLRDWDDPDYPITVQAIAKGEWREVGEIEV